MVVPVISDSMVGSVVDDVVVGEDPKVDDEPAALASFTLWAIILRNSTGSI